MKLRSSHFHNHKKTKIPLTISFNKELTEMREKKCKYDNIYFTPPEDYNQLETPSYSELKKMMIYILILH